MDTERPGEGWGLVQIQEWGVIVAPWAVGGGGPCTEA